MEQKGMWIWRASQTVNSDYEGFLRAMNLYINKPHVVNRRICGTKVLADVTTETVECAVQKLSEHVQSSERSLRDLLGRLVVESHGEEFRTVLQDCFPRQQNRHNTIRQLIMIDKKHSCTTFIPISQFTPENGDALVEKNEVSYRFSFVQNPDRTSIVLSIDDGIDGATGQLSVKWLSDHLLPKLCKWSEETDLNPDSSSLRLISVDKYSALYQQLKITYGQELVKIWPEKTDPYKFVYEDVAIATYLMLLWEQEREEKGLREKQSFVDLGCGNGLLVYILSSEGYKGLGLDVRRRKIWSLYPPHTILKELPVTPTENNTFPEHEWLIGNHSDELTPWIPVMAARSSYAHRFFVLPCCHHDFDSKFSYRVSGESQYRTYLNFIKQVGQKCGFEVQEDILRIPSTKRVCLIGQSREYTEDEEPQMDKTRTEYILSRCKKKQNDTKELITNDTPNEEAKIEHGQYPMETIDFKARCKVEKVRNCSQISHKIQSNIVHKVFEAVLNAENAEKVVTSKGNTWNRGGSIAVGRIAELFDRTMLQQLKSECGGLQTLLRNHHHIFQVSGGEVRLRYWTDEIPRKKKAKTDFENTQKNLKRKLCWFYSNHPDGCPDSKEVCRFAHGADDLKT